MLSGVQSVGRSGGGEQEINKITKNVLTLRIDGNKVFGEYRGCNYLMLICGVKGSFTEKVTFELKGQQKVSRY